MKTVFDLPPDYRSVLRLDLKSKKFALWLNLAAALIFVALVALGTAFVPLGLLFDLSEGLGIYALRFFVLLAGYLVYIVLHEAVHGVVIRLYSGKWGRFGFTGLYAYAGSDAYFPKLPYIVIALAPVVLFGILLPLLCALVPETWFWPIYFIACGNLAGAAGDIYVTARFCRLPKTVLVRDTGTAMEVFAPAEGET